VYSEEFLMKPEALKRERPLTQRLLVLRLRRPDKVGTALTATSFWLVNPLLGQKCLRLFILIENAFV